MVHYHRNNPLKKDGEVVVIEGHEESQDTLDLVWRNACHNKRTRPIFLFLLFLSFVSCSFILAPQFFCFPSNLSIFYSLGYDDGRLTTEMDVNTPLCSTISNGTICCERSSIRSDICMMKGDVRTHSLSSSLYLYNSRNSNGLIDYVPGIYEEGEEQKDNAEEIQHEKIKPYTRKWEKNTMDTVSELHLISKRENLGARHRCDVQHEVPTIFFSTGGYTGNIYHEFNDGILPLYITSQHFNKRVVFVIAEYHDWWFTKYRDILSLLSDYPPIDFRGDNRTHCFPEAIVGLRIHDELTVDPSLMEGGRSMREFCDLLDRAYWPRIKDLIEDEERKSQLNSTNKLFSPLSSNNEGKRKKWEPLKKPRLTILSRNGSRSITNEDLLVKMAKQIGFEVDVLRPEPTTELAKIYRVLNSSDVTVGVHGAGMTHFLFLRPKTVFIQVIPLGTEWAAETYYGEPAMKLGLKYIGYKILPRESSLYIRYARNDPVLNDPNSVNKKGWEFTKKIYLDHQTVRLNLGRFRKRLVRAYDYSLAKKNLHDNLQSE